MKKICFLISKIVFYKTWSIYDKSIPYYPLKEKHLKNLTAVTNRKKLLDHLPKNCIVAEIGVDEGTFSNDIITVCKPSKIHLIDTWGSKRYNQQKRNGVVRKFSKDIKKGVVEINLGLSTQVVNRFPDNYFDWIYIDTAHSYQQTKKELEMYSKKLKNKGIIAGHDFIIGNWNSMLKYGVINAVYEFCTKYDWELIYLTMDLQESPSYAIRKL